MTRFAIRKRFTLKPDVTEDMLIDIFRDRMREVFLLNRYPSRGNPITAEGQWRSLQGNCSISTTIKIDIEEDNICYCQIEAELAPRVWQIFGMFTLLGLLLISYISIYIALFIAVVLIVLHLIGFFCNCKCPEHDLNDIMEEVQLKYGLPSKK